MNGMTSQSQVFGAGQRTPVIVFPDIDARPVGCFIQGHAGVNVNAIKSGSQVLADFTNGAPLASNLITEPSPSIYIDFTRLFDEFMGVVVPVVDAAKGLAFDLTDTGGAVTVIVVVVWAPAT